MKKIQVYKQNFKAINKMKKLSLVGMLSFGSILFGQVGINTPSPEATLDITAKNPTGATTNPEGILIPRVSRQRAQSMVAVENSTLIYVNNITTGTATGTAVNITAVGFYYFHSTDNVWKKLAEGPNTSIYTDDGTLLSNRIVTQGARTLAFTGTQTNMFSVDGKTFSVDGANDRVGIGTDIPQNRLDLGSDMGSSITDVNGKKLAMYNTATGTSFYGLGVSENKLQFHANSAAAGAPAMVLDNNGNLGLGTTDPTHTLHVNGSMRFVTGSQAAGRVLTSNVNGDATWQTLPTPTNNTIYNANGTLNGNRTVTQDAFTLAFTGTARNAFSVDGTTFSVDAANNRVGIGTASPQNKLDLGTDIPTTTGAAAGKKLAVSNNSDGTAFYGIGVSTNKLQFHAAAAANDTPKMVLTNTGSVGIGTDNPVASAILQLDATDKGFLPPRLTTAQRNALTPKTAGMIVFNTDENCIQYWNSVIWKGNCDTVRSNKL